MRQNKHCLLTFPKFTKEIWQGRLLGIRGKSTAGVILP